MNLNKSTIKMIAICISATLIVLATACTNTKEKAAVNLETQNASSSSSISKTTQNDKISQIDASTIDTLVRLYYCTIRCNFDGKIESASMADSILNCLAVRGKSEFEKYKSGDNIIIPEDVLSEYLKKRFDVETIDPNIFTCYDKSKKAYVISSTLGGYGVFQKQEIQSILQIDDLIVVVANFYTMDERYSEWSPTRNNTNYKTNYDDKVATLTIVFKNDNNNYLYKRAEYKWEGKHKDLREAVTNPSETTPSNSISQIDASNSSAAETGDSLSKKSVDNIKNLVSLYYCEMRCNFNGKIDSTAIADNVLVLTAAKGEFGIEKYRSDDIIIIPEDVFAKYVKKRFDFDAESVDPNKFTHYDKNKKAYIVSLDSVATGDFVSMEVQSITQIDDLIVVVTNFYCPDDRYVDNNTGDFKTDYDDKIATLTITFKNDNNNFLYKKAEYIWGERYKNLAEK